jgi:hypothetical protein
MMQFGSNKILLKVKGYIMENWGSPFIVGFVVLLVIANCFCAISSFPVSTDIYSLPNTLAICAYFALAGGVSLQLARFLRCRDENDYVEEVS